jgi:hypothetical protein
MGTNEGTLPMRNNAHTPQNSNKSKTAIEAREVVDTRNLGAESTMGGCGFK